MDSLSSAEFTHPTTYLNTASSGLLPARTAAALHRAVDELAAGDFSGPERWIDTARAGYARLAGVSADRVAVGSSASVHAGLIASGLAPGAEVLVADGDFSSLVNPFAVRRDLSLRIVPLKRLAEEIRAQTALVAVSTVQSAHGRVADLAAIREAATRCGARVFLDATQSAGWLPLDAGAFDYVMCAPFKWMLCPRGAAFLTVAESVADATTPVFAGWTAGESPYDSTYGPITRLASSARRFDASPAFLVYAGVMASLSVIEEIGVATIGEHNKALARRFEEGVRSLGYEPVPTGGSAIVSVPGLDHAVPGLEKAGITVAGRAGNLRAAFHLYNSSSDVDTLLEALPARR
ncbi:aminotransferase class V-fold PLP-dependent enzyme [Streptantibioticus silvisoli]|uniref:Aminotransferase class V-fold PLP-dependent enzyme n=1 Tax=Streptantibioticus silvisoli TaxID=2705255 RepID=A0ABT6W318_9ACTN|nr:aminotransferase class V-fold PLP-dependent enzyme [Streptantibioticus silvisoli]MDI5965105.1 aminotransferase class V-fold PLP-dependent enzyme [Streptantibioticus silvisoli]